jgi:hypothetical protein
LLGVRVYKRPGEGRPSGLIPGVVGRQAHLRRRTRHGGRIEISLGNLDLGQLQQYLQGVNRNASTQLFGSPDQVLQAVRGRL